MLFDILFKKKKRKKRKHQFFLHRGIKKTTLVQFVIKHKGWIVSTIMHYFSSIFAVRRFVDLFTGPNKPYRKNPWDFYHGKS